MYFIIKSNFDNNMTCGMAKSTSFFLSFVYIGIAIGDPVIKREEG